MVEPFIKFCSLTTLSILIHREISHVVWNTFIELKQTTTKTATRRPPNKSFNE